MRFELIGKNVNLTERVQEQIEKKLTNLDKYLIIGDDTIARVVVREEPNDKKIEVTIPTKVGILRAEVEHEDLYAALDLAVDKLEDQIRRQKTRLNRRHKDSLAESFIQEELEEEDIPVRTKTIHAETMDLDEAIMQMELLGHNFFIFTDEESGSISVVYRRKNGGYGLIETTTE
ncbi:MAG: ribosome-associated translation inhibitor RaiA [Solobacterium sp.]|nr:ribosome-associated translation inhibitor RaiA [Solobacterium sp.]